MKKILLVLLFAVSIIILPIKLAAVPTTIGDRMYITAKDEAKTIKVGNTLELSANFLEVPSQSVTWSSDNNSVASVDNSGKVTGKSGGSTFIIATSADKKYVDVYNISVIEGDVSFGESLSISADGGKNAIDAGQVLKLGISFIESFSDNVTWESLNNDVATIDQFGLVTGVSQGNAIIKATAGNKSCGFVVKVYDVQTSSGAKIIINTPNNGQTISEGETMQLSVEFLEMSPQDVKWSSSDSRIAGVSTDGLVIGVGEGTAIITATSADGKYSASKTIMVGKKMSVNGENDIDSDANKTDNKDTGSKSSSEVTDKTTIGVGSISDNEPNFIADHKTLLIIIGAAVLVILVVALIVINKKNNNNQDTQN